MGMQTTRESNLRSRMLLIDKDVDSAGELARSALSCLASQPEVITAPSGRSGFDSLRANRFDIVVADLSSLTDLAESAEEAVGRLARVSEGALVLVLSEASSVSAAVAAMRGGAHDYLAKPVTGQAFAARIGELAERHGKTRALALEAPSGAAMEGFEAFVGRSSAMQYVYEQIARIAPSMAPVFITGESGTGKQLCAEALHAHGPAADGPLVTVRCAAMPSRQLEAELFGIVSDAHTGLCEAKPGAAELANGGTLFVNEIAELDLSMQARLLRFLQTGAVSRVGESTSRQVQVRVICATSRNLMQMIKEKAFREDLFYRLHVLPIHLPPLRQRPSDIMVLARHFLTLYGRRQSKMFTGFSPDAEEALMQRDWPGNVGELSALMRRVALTQDAGIVTRALLESCDTGCDQPTTRLAQRQRPSPILPMWQQEQRIIEEAISAFNGNISMAAAALEISPSTIYRKRQSWANSGAA
ncbi:hypothetical protein GCM10007989_28760 [Devosia pacifica]|uniref:Sigma-54-dependent Fis family transcriptional regulator n=1 Tax=Devosia pacifica TaxID=1335967 RepID=A0A918SA70_9HYPH|nr:sigma-54 dependent transcriptional regulator [Devosia pacifica]GHA31065.1 hypothetical protein GCM10007989_28760 [Devosia pacifica]